MKTYKVNGRSVTKKIKEAKIKFLKSIGQSRTYPMTDDRDLVSFVTDEGWYTEEETENLEVYYCFRDDGIDTYIDGRTRPVDDPRTPWGDTNDRIIDRLFLDEIIYREEEERGKSEMDIPFHYIVLYEGELKVYGEIKLRNPICIWSETGGFFW